MSSLHCIGSETGNGNVTDGATITLKAGETATITGLPVGTTYTVTETEIPTGFEAEQEPSMELFPGKGTTLNLPINIALDLSSFQEKPI